MKSFLLVFCFSIISSSAVTIPFADGSDGALNATGGDIDLDTSLAAQGSWTNSSPVVGQGIYDPSVHAVVYKFSSVTVNSSRKVQARANHTSAPMVWLVTGDVTIDGTVNVNGHRPDLRPYLSPGSRNANVRHGLGWGGGILLDEISSHRTKQGDFNGSPAGTPSTAPTYGNHLIMPLTGGSSAPKTSNGRQGGAGGGALLIACGGTLRINGAIQAVGGATYANGTTTGSGGAIRIIANRVEGNGDIDVQGGVNYSGDGWIRIESPSITGNIDSKFIPVSRGNADGDIHIFPPSDYPSVEIVSVKKLDGTTLASTPVDPTANLTIPDISMSETNMVDVIIRTRNADPASSTVKLRVMHVNQSVTFVDATHVPGGGTVQSEWACRFQFQQGMYTIMAKLDAL